MKIASLATLVVALVVVASIGLGAKEKAAAPAALKLGKAAPSTAVKMKNVDGKRLSIAEVKGEKGTLVVFTCNHCPFVIAWEDRMVALANEYAKKGVGVIFVNPNDPTRKPQDGFENMQKRAKTKGMAFPYVVDEGSVVARAFGAARTPECFLFDAKMKLVYHGAVDDNSRSPDRVTKRYLSDALAALVAGETSKEKVTRAPGCSIKWRPEPSPSGE